MLYYTRKGKTSSCTAQQHLIRRSIDRPETQHNHTLDHSLTHTHTQHYTTHTYNTNMHTRTQHSTLHTYNTHEPKFETLRSKRDEPSWYLGHRRSRQHSTFTIINNTYAQSPPTLPQYCTVLLPSLLSSLFLVGESRDCYSILSNILPSLVKLASALDKCTQKYHNNNVSSNKNKRNRKQLCILF